MSSIRTWIDSVIQKTPVVVFSKTYCPYCTKAKNTLKNLITNSNIIIYELDEMDNGNEIQNALSFTGATSVPRVFVGGKFIGGGDDTVAKAKSGELQKLIANALEK